MFVVSTIRWKDGNFKNCESMRLHVLFLFVQSWVSSWIESLYHQADKNCSSSEKCRFQINKIKTCHGMVILLLHLIPSIKNISKKWIRLPYLGNIGDSLRKNLRKYKNVRKVRKYLFYNLLWNKENSNVLFSER